MHFTIQKEEKQEEMASTQFTAKTNVYKVQTTQQQDTGTWNNGCGRKNRKRESHPLKNRLQIISGLREKGMGNAIYHIENPNRRMFEILSVSILKSISENREQSDSFS